MTYPTLEKLREIVHEEYERNGFEKGFNEHGILGDIAELGLITTEVSEAIEKVRKQEVGLEEELADIVIRVLNFCYRKNIVLTPIILWKNEVNLKRCKLHGDVDWAKR